MKDGYIGTPGQRIKLEVTLESHLTFQTSGGGELLKFNDRHGNRLLLFTKVGQIPNGIDINKIGSKYKIEATVLYHKLNTYRGKSEKQTNISNVVVL